MGGFVGELLIPLEGEITYIDPSRGGPSAGSWSITIPLAPFSADEQFSTEWRRGTDGPEIIHTNISLDFVSLPGTDLAGLAGRRFSFPSNPDVGYIDGSVYLAASHNPVDVAEIRFGEHWGDVIPATVDCTFAFSVELSTVPDHVAEFEVLLRFRHLL